MYRLYYPNIYNDDISHCPDPSVSTSLVTRKDAWNDCVVKVPLSVANVFPEIFKAFSHFFDEMDTIVSADVIPRLKMTQEQIRWCQDDDSCNGAVMDGSLSGPQTVLAMVDAFDDHISNGQFAILETERLKQEAAEDVDEEAVAEEIHEARKRWGMDKVRVTIDLNHRPMSVFENIRSIRDHEYILITSLKYNYQRNTTRMLRKLDHRYSQRDRC